MSDDPDLHNTLIRALGGKARLAAMLGVDRALLTKWHVRGIPARYWHRIIALAQQLDPPIEVTPDDLEQSKGQQVAA